MELSTSWREKILCAYNENIKDLKDATRLFQEDAREEIDDDDLKEDKVNQRYLRENCKRLRRILP